MIVSEMSHELNSVMVTTLNSDAVNSPTLDSAKKIGRKAAAVVSEAVNNGVLSSSAEANAALMQSFPSPCEP